jgi:hypothetical protein
MSYETRTPALKKSASRQGGLSRIAKSSQARKKMVSEKEQREQGDFWREEFFVVFERFWDTVFRRWFEL